MPDLDDEDEFTELTGAQFSRIDLVRAPANGSPGFLVMKQDESAGLLDASYVRDLIAKAEPDQPEPGTREDSVTMTGTPAAIAKLIHEAAQKPAAEVAKAEMSSGDISDLPDSAFAYIEPGGKKDASGKTTPRKLRHFPIHDKAHADNAAARIAQGAKFGDKAKGKVTAAQRKFGEKVSKEAGDVVGSVAKDAGDMLDAQLDDGVDGMDPTVPLAAPDDDAPGDPTDPGSPAWEAIDAATATKWCSILSRARVAIDLLSEREMLEAASADPDDMDNACDLQDVCCAIDYAISVLAPFAVSEQSEADCGGDDLMAAIGKAVMSIGENQLAAIEGLVPVAKAGRVLSSANEALIRTAGESLQKVLASLPSAPLAADDVAKETAVDDAQPAADAPVVAKEDAAPAAPQTPAAEGASRAAPVAKGALHVVVFDRAGGMCQVDPARISHQIAKADADAGDGSGKPEQVAVYDSEGNLVGVADPADITPLSNVKAPAKNQDDTEKPADPDAAPAADPADMTPAPPADAGTPADGVAKAGDTETSNDDSETTSAHEVLKSLVAEGVAAALDARSPAEDVAKQADVASLLEEVSVLKARLAAVEETPAAPKVFTNGAVPPPGTLRGQDRTPAGGPQVDVAKARELKSTLYHGTATEQNDAARQMQEAAIAQLSAIHSGR